MWIIIHESFFMMMFCVNSHLKAFLRCLLKNVLIYYFPLNHWFSDVCDGPRQSKVAFMWLLNLNSHTKLFFHMFSLCEFSLKKHVSDVYWKMYWSTTFPLIIDSQCCCGGPRQSKVACLSWAVKLATTRHGPPPWYHLRRPHRATKTKENGWTDKLENFKKFLFFVV